MTSDIQLLDSIPDTKPVRAFIPISGKTERYRASCVLEKTGSGTFDLVFQPGILPAESVDLSKTCLITVDMGGPNISLEARIKRIAGKQTLQMMLEKSISHEQMREFFRVDATTSVISRSFQPEFYDQKGEPWSVKGRTIDIGGSGILAVFPEPPPNDKQVKLDITLPTTEGGVVSVLAHPVRITSLGENHHEVAYHFDDITIEDRDRIIGCCLLIQRQMLRLKVQVKNAVKL